MAESQLYATNCCFKRFIYFMKPENGDRTQRRQEDQSGCSQPLEKGLWHAEMEGFLSRNSDRRKSGFLCRIMLAIVLGVLLQN